MVFEKLERRIELKPRKITSIEMAKKKKIKKR